MAFDMAFGMANLHPEDTGLRLNVHAYKDIDVRAKHGPRVKVYPGKYRKGNATTIEIPGTMTEPAEVIGRPTLHGRDLKVSIAFVEDNRLALLAFWYEPSFSERDLVDAIK